MSVLRKVAFGPIKYLKYSLTFSHKKASIGRQVFIVGLLKGQFTERKFAQYQQIEMRAQLNKNRSLDGQSKTTDFETQRDL